MSTRLCGPECCYPGEPHLDPEPDWIGDCPVMHGESERPVPGTGFDYGTFIGQPDAYCLCGHPSYLTCPYFGEIFSFEITAAAEGVDE